MVIGCDLYTWKKDISVGILMKKSINSIQCPAHRFALLIMYKSKDRTATV